VLTQASFVLMVVSTYGEGEPPDDAAPVWEAVVPGNGLDLGSVKYFVLALGDTTYDQFCKCGRNFDAALERHGAMPIYPRVDCDAGYDDPAKRWFDGVLASLAWEPSAAPPPQAQGESPHGQINLAASAFYEYQFIVRRRIGQPKKELFLVGHLSASTRAFSKPTAPLLLIIEMFHAADFQS